MEAEKKPMEIPEDIKRDVYGFYYKDEVVVFETITDMKIWLKNIVICHDKLKGTTVILPRILVEKEKK